MYAIVLLRQHVETGRSYLDSIQYSSKEDLLQKIQVLKQNFRIVEVVHLQTNPVFRRRIGEKTSVRKIFKRRKGRDYKVYRGSLKPAPRRLSIEEFKKLKKVK